MHTSLTTAIISACLIPRVLGGKRIRRMLPEHHLNADTKDTVFNLPTAPGAPATLDPFSAFYFSFITLCTVGYGDITPVSKVARMLAILEGITGLFYMAVLISRLVSMYSSAPPFAPAGIEREP